MQKRFDKSINPLLSEISEATSNGVALSVSGGSDSIALLHLTSTWAKSRKIRLVVFSVNHNLRPESSEEIEFVKIAASGLGHEFYELSWDNGGNKVAIQERARDARYSMISKKCHEFGINILLTAHHLDDMLETYLMRKNKKSSILGLSYSNSFFYNNTQVIRPLSSFLKSELIDYLNSLNIKWLEDSSNLLAFPTCLFNEALLKVFLGNGKFPSICASIICRTSLSCHFTTPLNMYFIFPSAFIK
ncbi:tRNA(Ile)-lysidine synthase [Candidatus Megaera venefica]|uniref:tRNA(Ile)-lysidine synthase n=2 Tax=Candidatus Megaera venefica TaxID=2055910 RepID=A0ABU5NBG8_9RICK|nr:tRNA(Ile)-lysidine synthase [Candidatus Megaera venefica]